MRKWMSERLKRRKKPKDETTKEATKAPEPLQPRFYDDDPAAATASVAPDADGVEARRPSKPKREPQPAPEAAAEPVAGLAPASAEGAPGPRAPRRRRSRGGRGSSRRRPAAAASAELSAEEVSAVEIQTGTLAEAPAEASGAETAVAAPVPMEAAATEASLAQAAPAPPAQVASVPARASKGTVVLAIGLPGSGKSSWFKRHNIHPLSSDLLRELLFDDAQEQRFQDLVFSNLRSMLKARLIARRPMNYVDATNLTPHDRHSWIKLAKDYGYDVQGVFFDVPVEICLERHQRRGRAVPEDVMRKMAGKMKPPTFEEGFSKITVVRLKQKETAAE
jgi:predicted kinase